MQNEKTQSTKIIWGFGIAIAVLIGLFLFREQWNRILFCLDIRYWPVWAPRLLWILVGLMILNLLTTWYLRLKLCDVTDSAAIKQSVNVDRSVLLSSIKRFALFLLVIEALRLSGYKLSVLFSPFFKMYRYFFGCYSFYFDFGTHTIYQQSIMRLKPFIPLPVFIITLSF